MPRKIILSADDERRFRKMWGECCPVASICEAFGIATDTANSIRARLGLPPRTAATRAPRRAPQDDPTPEQIEAMLVELRAKHLARRRAEPAVRRYRDDDGEGGRVYPASIFDADR